MSNAWQWSLETYKLNKIKELFGVPCVIRLTEGYMSDDESEEFARGDILTIDTELVSDKVAAMFTTHKPQEVAPTGKHVPDYGIITSCINQPEVFLPYGYDGKLKVLKQVADVSGVKELARVFPRYATVKEGLHLKTNTGESVKISKGTRIELDRILPGSMYGKDKEADKLVIKFEHAGTPKVAALSFSSKGKFRTEEDHNEYTISEAIDKYDLPLDVKFSSNEIKQIFNQEMSEGRRPRTKVTGTLRLNRIVKQHVLVGHYKPIYGAEADTDATRKRTVIVLPVDNPDIGEIEVNIYDGDVLTIYDKLVNIQSVSDVRDMVKDTLCVDFSVKPSIKLIAETTRKYANVSHGNIKQEDASHTKREESISSVPPPLPKRPTNPVKIHEGNVSGGDKSVYSKPPHSHYKTLPTRGMPASEDDLEDGYEIPAKLSPPYVHMSGKDLKNASSKSVNKPSIGRSDDKPPVLPRVPVHMPLTTPDSAKTEKGKKPPTGKLWPSIKGSFKAHTKHKHEKMIPMPEVAELSVEEEGLAGYEEMAPFKNGNNETRNQMSEVIGASMPVQNNNLLGEYEDLCNPQGASVAVVRPVGTNSNMPRDDVNEGYEEIADVLALRKQSEISEDVNRNVQTRAPQQHDLQTSSLTSEVESTQMTHRSAHPVGTTTRHEAQVCPSRGNVAEQTIKPFQDLTNEELVERLTLCNIPDLAEICKAENLDGAFFEDSTVDFLKETMGLQGLKLAKFLKMKDENWVPK